MVLGLVIANTPLQVLYGIIMHQANYIQHEGEAQGLYVVTHECIIIIILYSTCRGVLTDSYPHRSNSITSVVSDYDREGRYLYSS